MDVSESYKQHPELDDHYDAICIGSGLGSLTTANLMARHGKKVLVLEKHYTPGGFTHVFKRPEYEWDVGLHYVGDAHKKGTMMYSLFKYLSDGKMEWADMGNVYDRIVFGKKSFDFVKGVTNFKDMLKQHFPEEKKAIDDYISILFKVNKSNQMYFMEKVLPESLRFFVSGLFRRSYLKYASKTTYEVLSSLTSNEELIGVIAGQYGDCGLPPRQSSFAIHAAIAKHYMTNGGSYPVKGSAEFFNTMAPQIIKAGGKVLTNAAVEEVLISNNTATGVRMKGGREINAKMVISGAGIGPTFNHLIAKENMDLFPMKDFRSVPPSTSHFCLYIGLNESSNDLNLPKANFWLYPDNYDHDRSIEHYLEDIENHPFPVTYISFPSAKDPDWENRYPGKSTIEIITLGPYDSVEQWADTRWKKRGEDYDAFKERFSQRMLDKLYEVMPHLKGKIDYYELSTPLSTRHFANYDRGEIYGVDHSPERFGLKTLRPKTAVKNFYLTGQDITTAGIAGAALAGVLTASAILKKNILMDIMKMR